MFELVLTVYYISNANKLVKILKIDEYENISKVNAI